MMHKKFISLVSSISVMALSILSISPASAENLNTNYSSQSGIYSMQDNISPDMLNEARKEFIAAGYSYDVVDLAQGEFFKFYIEEGAVIFLPSEQLLTKDAVSPSAYSSTASGVKAGKHDGGLRVELNWRGDHEGSRCI